MVTPRTFDTQVPIVKLFNAAVDLPIMVAGQINDANKLKQAQELSSLIGIGRPLVKDPNWLTKINSGKSTANGLVLTASEIGVAQSVYQVL